MTNTIHWSKSSINTRQAVAELCGWKTREGKITSAGKRIAATEWKNLSDGVKNILLHHGVKE